jgi:hypothetical protein
MNNAQIKEEEQKKQLIRKYVEELFGDKYSITFVCIGKKSIYSEEILKEISEIESILQLVQDKLDFCKNLRKRTSENVSEKYALIYCLRNSLGYRPRAIAHVLTNRDHTTIPYACQKAEDWIYTEDPIFTDIIFQITQII